MKGRVARIFRAIVSQRALSVLVVIGYMIAMVGSITVVNTKKASAGSVVYKASASAANVNASSVTITKPTGTTTDDVMIAVISIIGSSTTITPPAGWTSINKATNSTLIATEAFWKRAGASEGTDYAFTTSGSNTQVVGGISLYRGVTTSGSPIGNQGADGSGSGATLTAPVVNIGTAQSKAIAVFSSEDEAPSSHTPPAGMKERFDVASSRNGVGNRDTTTSLADILRGSTGNFGANSATAAASNVYVAFQFELLADDVVHMLLFWDGLDHLGGSLSLPSGWSIVDDADGRFIRGETVANYGGIGGSSTHTPGVSGAAVGAANNSDVDSGGQTPQASTAGHTHTDMSGTTTIGSANNLPAYRNLALIRYDAGITNTIPAGAIAIFDGSPGLPGSGWTQVSAQNSRFARTDSNNMTTTGGSDTHIHSIDLPGTTSNGSGQINRASFLANVAVADPSHNHTITDTGLDTGDNAADPCEAVPVASSCFPPYVDTILGKANSNTPTISVGFAAMFDGSPGGGWVVRSDSTGPGPFYQRFMRGANSYIENLGADTHTHSNATVTTGQSSATNTSTRNLLGNAMSRQTHTHVVTTSFNAASNIPPYFNVVVGEKVNLILTNYWWFLDNSLKTPTDPWGNPDISEDTPTVVLPIATAQPVDLGDDMRLRIQILINGNDLADDSIELKLQYNATNSSLCTTDTGTWVDLGDNDATDKDWRYTPSTSITSADSIELDAFPGGRVTFTDLSNIPQLYIRGTSPGNNANPAVISDRIEYDFHIENYAAAGATQYSFRVLEANGTLLSQYGEDAEVICPTVTTMPRTENQLRHGNYFKTDPAGDATGVLEGGFSWVD